MSKQQLWEGFRIPVITVVGEAGAGKTMFGLCIDNNCLLPPDFPDVPKTTVMWDMEGSGASYDNVLNFKRIDLPEKLLESGLTSYHSTDLFQYWRRQVLAVKPGVYRVGIIDTVTELEEGIVSYVRKNPTEFGYTSEQFAKLEGLVWGAVKAEWKRLLMVLTTKMETIVLTAHMRDEFRGARPTGRRIPKGKETIKDVTSVYLVLDRSPSPGTKSIPVVPSAKCLKSRLVRKVTNNGVVELQQVLPPSIDSATPNQIRKYLLAPPDLNNLDVNEMAKADDQSMSEEQRLLIVAGMEEAKAQRAQAELAIKEIDSNLAKRLVEQKSKEVTVENIILPMERVDPPEKIEKPVFSPETRESERVREVYQEKVLPPPPTVEQADPAPTEEPVSETVSPDLEYKLKRVLLETKGLSGAKSYLSLNYNVQRIKELSPQKAEQLLAILNKERSTQLGN